MRMRTKKWARPELAACDFFIGKPRERRESWADGFEKKQPLHLELGCGKGIFLAELAKQNPGINYIGVDISMDILGVARRNIVKTYDRPVDNLQLTCFNIEYIQDVFGGADEMERIYICFCNPWNRERHKKRRLTHPRQLAHYRPFLKDGGEIHFKTDDDELFGESLAYFAESGFEVTYLTRDLHASGYPDNIVTEHELKFTEEGIRTKFCIARKVEWDGPDSAEEKKQAE